MEWILNNNEAYMKKIFGHAESIMSYDTYQFKDYSKVVADLFDGDMKKKRRQEDVSARPPTKPMTWASDLPRNAKKKEPFTPSSPTLNISM